MTDSTTRSSYPGTATDRPSAAPLLDQPYYGIGFRGAVQRAFRKVTTLEGRASLSEYWRWVLFQTLVLLVLYVPAAGLVIVGGERGSTGLSLAGGALGILLAMYFLATLVPTVTVGVPRLHDAGLSGWLHLVGLIPFVGPMVLIVLLIMDSSPSGARFDRPDSTPRDGRLGGAGRGAGQPRPEGGSYLGPFGH